MKIRELCNLINEDTFIISDTHFGHENMLIYEPIRNKIQLEKSLSIESYMISNWNIQVGNNDVVLHLGDFAWHEVNVWASQLNGKKILMRGNHDHGKDSAYSKAGLFILNYSIIDLQDDFNIIKWEGPGKRPKMRNCLIKEINGKRIMFSHLPVFDENNQFDLKFQPSRDFLQSIFDEYKCDINIHGHVHSNTPECRICINVSVEDIGFKPIKIKELLSRNFEA